MCNMRRHPMSSKFYLFKWKKYFSKFTGKFLKIEEVEYPINMLNLKCDQRYFM